MATLETTGRRPPHDSTPTSQANRLIERRLMHDLNRIVNAIRQELPNYRLSKGAELDARIKPMLHSHVLATFRKHITDSYSLGMNYVTSLPSLKGIPGYLTSSDLEIIKTLAASYSTRFWGRTSISLRDQNTITLNYAEISDHSLLNPNYIVNSLGIGATNEALNQATLQKARVLTGTRAPTSDIGITRTLTGLSSQTIQSNQSKRASSVAVAALDDLFPDLPLELELTAEWVTSMDDRVCEICEGLEGDYFLDEEVPQPVEDSHPNCRCRLLIEGA